MALLYALENIADKQHLRLWKRVWDKRTKNYIKAILLACLESTPKFGKFITKAKENFKEIKENDTFDNVKSYKKITDNISKAFKQHKDKKFVIIIDEIDRCMPEYAIRFLETLKHFFDISGLYFILMFNENHLQKSLQNRFDYVEFALWKDKFIDLEFDLSIFHNKENFIKYLVEEKYKFEHKHIDNLKMYITYKYRIIAVKGGRVDLDAKRLFGNSWVSYINNFLGSLNIELNNRQLNMLCLRLKLALDIMQYKDIMPDCLMCVILKDIFKGKKLDKKNGYSEIEFTYYNGKENKHILNLFYDGEENISHSSIRKTIFAHGISARVNDSDNNEITTYEDTSSFDANKKAAEFAILAVTQ